MRITMKIKNKKLFIATMSISLLLDQCTKFLIKSYIQIGNHWPENWELIRLSHIRNTGGIFGIMQNMNDILLIFSIIIIMAILGYILFLTHLNLFESISFGLIIGGGIGNIIDRIIDGSVTDFIDPIYYPAFNLADSSIVIGIIAYLFFTLKGSHHGQEN